MAYLLYRFYGGLPEARKVLSGHSWSTHDATTPRNITTRWVQLFTISKEKNLERRQHIILPEYLWNDLDVVAISPTYEIIQITNISLTILSECP